MGWIETRIGTLETRLEFWIRQIQDLIQQVKAAAAMARNAYGQYNPANSSGGGGVYVCYPTTIVGATGTFPSLVPSSQSLTVYQVQGTAITSVGTFTVYNWLPASPAASKVAYCLPDGAGNYVLIDQSCV